MMKQRLNRRYFLDRTLIDESYKILGIAQLVHPIIVKIETSTSCSFLLKQLLHQLINLLFTDRMNRSRSISNRAEEPIIVALSDKRREEYEEDVTIDGIRHRRNAWSIKRPSVNS